jgi:hypothetical protein
LEEDKASDHDPFSSYLLSEIYLNKNIEENEKMKIL